MSLEAWAEMCKMRQNAGKRREEIWVQEGTKTNRRVVAREENERQEHRA
jgi:hypothetical protein